MGSLCAARFPANVSAQPKKASWHRKTNSLWHSGFVAVRGGLGATVRAARVALNPLFTASSIHRASRRREVVLTTVGKLSQGLEGKHGCAQNGIYAAKRSSSFMKVLYKWKLIIKHDSSIIFNLFSPPKKKHLKKTTDQLLCSWYN